MVSISERILLFHTLMFFSCIENATFNRSIGNIRQVDDSTNILHNNGQFVFVYIFTSKMRASLSVTFWRDSLRQGAASNALLYQISIFLWLPLNSSIHTEAVGGPDQLRRCWSGEVHNKNVFVSGIYSIIWGVSMYFCFKMRDKRGPDHY